MNVTSVECRGQLRVQLWVAVSGLLQPAAHTLPGFHASNLAQELFRCTCGTRGPRAQRAC